ncbi:MAG: FAD-dependent oxidoreductase [Clostridia bacterium]|nr:FAD-dependent oxidoreductase [Clostridia bacterium]
MSVRSKNKEAAFDVVIVGGGMTGMCAALACARHGAKTALVQDRPVFGGNASSEIRMHICGASSNMMKKDAEETGILRELLLENKKVNTYYNFSIWDRVLFTAMKTQPNLTVFLNTTMVDADSEGRCVKGIHCYQLTTEINWHLTADIFCDCTGNGTLGFMTGVPFRTGSEGKEEFHEKDAPDKPNNDRMGNTLLFKAVDRGQPVEFIPPKDAYHFTEEQLRYRKHADLRAPDGSILEEKADAIMDNLDEATKNLVVDNYCLDYGYWWIELTGEKADIIEEYEDIRDELVKCVYGIWDHIKNGGDHGAQNFDLQWVGMLPGMRESRRLEGDYMLTENDIFDNRIFPDAVAYGGWDCDNHVAHGLLDFDKMPSSIFPFKGLYTIPYGCYVAKEMDNLFISGRSMSASKLAMASSRVMGTCAVGGQAVGTAAAMCIKYGCGTRGVKQHMTELQQTLLKDDCYIPGYKNEDPLDLARTAKVTATSEKHAAVNVINGVARTVEENINCWQSNGIRPEGEELYLSFEQPKKVSQVRLTFDPNLNASIRLSLSSKRIAEQVPGVPPELVKDFDVELRKDGEAVAVKQVRGNYQRLNVLDFQPVECDEVVLRVLATNGIADARVYEVRVY